jgi:hypothetical protein
MKGINDIATIIFDLKGPIPRVSKLSNNKEVLEVKKNQLVKLVYENKKINDPDVIHIDRKIIDLIKLGDRIVIDSSNTILKVIGIDRYKRKNSNLSASRFDNNTINTINTFESFLDQDMLDDIQLNINKLHTIEEKDENEEEGFLHVEHYLDSNDEERMKQRSIKIRQAYQSVINKHKGYNDYLKINELKYLSSSETNSRKFILILVHSLEDNYKIKRERIINSAASSKKNMNMIICEAQHNGTIRLHKKLFLLDKEIVSEMGISPIGIKDIIDINKVPELGINIVTALVNNSDDIDEIRELFGEYQERMKIFARIETSESMYKFDSILEKSDGIIINHGLISSKIPYEEVKIY